MLCPCCNDQADLEACPTEEILLIGDPNKVYGEQWYFTYTAEAFESQLNLQRAGEAEEKARLEAEAEVKKPRRDIKLLVHVSRRGTKWKILCSKIEFMLKLIAYLIYHYLVAGTTVR